jgi:uncharacterized protein (TIGR02679 family)
MNAPLPDPVRRALTHPALDPLWERARDRLQTTDLIPVGRITVPVPDTEAARELGALLGRRAPTGGAVRVDLVELDAALRRGAAARGLLDILTELSGPLASRPAAKAAKKAILDDTEATLRRALDDHRLCDEPWVGPWLTGLRQQGLLARIGRHPDAATLADHVAAVLAHIHLNPTRAATSIVDRGDLASRRAGGAHALDDGQFLTNLVHRAAALAHHTPTPDDARTRRDLWNRCAVSVDEVSTTLLTWALPILGEDPWATLIRQRTSLGLETHLTRRELRRMRPDSDMPLVPPGTQIAVCENPRVLAAAAERAAPHPLICTFGTPTTLAIHLLERLAANGAHLRYHGDFDPAGLMITAFILSIPGIEPWRMHAIDYHHALAHARTHAIDLPPLDGTVPDTPWDPDLAKALDASGLALEEEVVLELLLADLAPPETR